MLASSPCSLGVTALCCAVPRFSSRAGLGLRWGWREKATQQLPVVMLWSMEKLMGRPLPEEHDELV